MTGEGTAERGGMEDENNSMDEDEDEDEETPWSASRTCAGVGK